MPVAVAAGNIAANAVTVGAGAVYADAVNAVVLIAVA